MESRVWTSLDTQRARLSGPHSRVFPSIATSRLLISPSLVHADILPHFLPSPKIPSVHPPPPPPPPKTQYKRLPSNFSFSKVDQPLNQFGKRPPRRRGYRVSRVVYTSPLYSPTESAFVRSYEETRRNKEKECRKAGQCVALASRASKKLRYPFAQEATATKPTPHDSSMKKKKQDRN